ncbi:hypothetical protein E2C01_006622 [Portunus trituberculatus]|uniref:Uncharacterized protein n=1 Tax=Portunus trituberculatus TaxID=210409 RepID=A0A5B7D2A7_PORTR|nr:hypothetical protein [Portunus trituberculatus]
MLTWMRMMMMTTTSSASPSSPRKASGMMSMGLTTYRTAITTDRITRSLNAIRIPRQVNSSAQMWRRMRGNLAKGTKAIKQKGPLRCQFPSRSERMGNMS